ncbi:trypsin-like cysteine/serine peptidase domain-containing protein, partial [Piptocephalis cylindrospora]
IPVKQMVMDSRFSPINTRYDVALLELDMPLGLSDTLHPIPILQPQVNLTFPEDVRLRAVGWGQTEQSRLSQTLMVTELRQPPMEYCAKGLPDLMGPDESIRIEWVCAASPKPDLGGHDTCFGDSGGALIA